MNKSRNYGIDILKILSMFMVVILLVLGQGGILKKTTCFTVNDSIANLFEIMCYCAVDIFVICTGYLYAEKLKIYKKYNITGFEKDLYYNNINHTIIRLIGNESNHKCSLNEKIKELKEIRNSELVSDTLKNISPFVVKTKVKYLIWLLKLRQYFLLSLMLK